LKLIDKMKLRLASRVALVSLVSLASAQNCEIDCEPTLGCAGSQLDVVFTLDESGSMYWVDYNADNPSLYDNRFTKAVTFVSNLKSAIQELYPQAMFGLSAWSQQCYPVADPDGYMDCCSDHQGYTCSPTPPTSREEKKIYLPGIRTLFDVRGAAFNPGQSGSFDPALAALFPQGRATQAEQGLQNCKDQLIPGRTDSLGSPVQRICIILTDGKQNGNSNLASDNAEDLRNAGVTVVSIGMGSVFLAGTTPYDDLTDWASESSSGSKLRFAALNFQPSSLQTLLDQVSAAVTCFSLDLLPSSTCVMPGSTLTLQGSDLMGSTTQQCRFFRGTSLDSASQTANAISGNSNAVSCRVPTLSGDLFSTTYFVEVSKDGGNTWSSNRNRVLIGDPDTIGCAAPTNEAFEDPPTGASGGPGVITLPTVPPTDKTQLGQVGGGGGANQPGVSDSISASSITAPTALLFAAVLGTM
jgi:hypothetical protein